MNIILYSNNCPKCKILKQKLNDKNIVYEEVNDVDLMISKGFSEVPLLEIDGEIYRFNDAVQWVNRTN